MFSLTYERVRPANFALLLKLKIKKSRAIPIDPIHLRNFVYFKNSSFDFKKKITGLNIS